MKKRLIPIIIALVYSLNIIPAFAEYDVDEVYSGIENDLLISEDSGIIDISEITEDNVLFQAMQNKPTLHKFGLKKARRKNNDTDTTEISADFDIVMNFDMSNDMYDFDINGDKEWLEDFKAIAEQAPDNTRYAVVSSDTDGFTYDLETSIDDVKNDNYTGESDIVTMLDDSAAAFDDDSDNRNKVVIATTQTVEDADELEDKLNELRNDDVIPFVFVLNEETDDSLDIDGVYQCATDLELRVAISDLYLSFGEFNVALNSTTTGSATLLDTDYKPRHKFNNMENSDGLKMASILNMYKCVPLYALTNQLKYDFLNTPGFNAQQREWFLKANNEKVNAFPSDFSSVWDNIFQSIDSETKVFKEEDDIAPTIVKNLKRRFPIMVKILKPQETNTVGEPEYLWRIATAYDASTGMIDSFNDNGDIEISIDDIKSVFDTYEYILNTVYSSTNLYDKVNWQNGSIAVDTIYPHEYEMVIDGDYSDMTIKRAPMIEADSGIQGIESVINGNTLHTTITKERNFLIESLVTYTNGYPDIYCANKEYRIRFFNDIEPNKWYTDYVFECTNKGIINGYTDNTFRPSREVSRCELLVMLLKAADIDLETVKRDYNDLSKVIPDDIKMLLETKIQTLSAQQINKSKLSGDGIDLNTSHANYEDTLMGVDKKQNGWEAFWGKAYMNYGLVHGIISVDEYLGLDLTEKVVREGKDDIPSNYVGIDKFIGGNIKLSREQSARMIWEFLNNKRENISVPTLLFDYDKEPADKSTNYRYMAFEDYNIDKNTPEGEAIYELFMNGVMNGHDSTEMGEIELLSRAQVCVLIIKSLFNMDENVPVLEANFEEQVELEPVKISVNSEEEFIKDIAFTQSNTALFEITISNNHRYLLETTSNLTNTTLNSELECIKNGHYSNKNSHDNTKNIMYVLEGKGIYKLTLTRSGYDNVSLKITDMDEAPALGFVPTYVNSVGKKMYYIYDDNEEYLKERLLADGSEKSSIAHFDNLTPGVYTVLCYHHRGGADANYYNQSLYFDVVLNAESSHSFKINKIACGNDWHWKEVWERFKLSDVSNENIYAETIYGSDYLRQGDCNSFKVSDNNAPMFWLMEFEVYDGTASLDTIAYRSKSNVDLNNLKPGKYVADRQPKGIAQNAPETNLNINYILDDELTDDIYDKENKKLKIKIKNSRYPQGKIVTDFATSITSWDRYFWHCSAETDMMRFQYEDQHKLDCYGEQFVGEKNSIWYFDALHNQLTRDDEPILPPYYIKGNTINEKGEEVRIYDESKPFSISKFGLPTGDLFEPNALNSLISAPEFETNELHRQELAEIVCNLGNYGVTYIYNINIRNIGTKPRTISFTLNEYSQRMIKCDDCDDLDDDDILKLAGYYYKEAGKPFSIPFTIYGGTERNIKIEVACLTGNNACILQCLTCE